MQKNANLKCGSQWGDHEDCIVGDEQGLQNLIKACEAALSKGEYFGDDLDDYIGVKKIESGWFDDPKDPKVIKFSNKFIFSIFIILLLLLMVGGFIKIFEILF